MLRSGFAGMIVARTGRLFAFLQRRTMSRRLSTRWQGNWARQEAMFQSFVPFPTAMMGEYPTNSLAVTAFGIVMACNTLLFIALHAYILRHLIRPELAQAQDPHIIRKSFVGVFSYSIGAAAAWLSVYLSFAIYLLTPLFFIVPPTKRDVGTSGADG